MVKGGRVCPLFLDSLQLLEMYRMREKAAYESGMTYVELALLGVVFVVGIIAFASLTEWTFPLLLSQVTPTTRVTIAP